MKWIRIINTWCQYQESIYFRLVVILANNRSNVCFWLNVSMKHSHIFNLYFRFQILPGLIHSGEQKGISSDCYTVLLCVCAWVCMYACMRVYVCVLCLLLFQLYQCWLPLWNCVVSIFCSIVSDVACESYCGKYTHLRMHICMHTHIKTESQAHVFTSTHTHFLWSL